MHKPPPATKLRYENIPHKRGGRPRVWYLEEELKSSFFWELFKASVRILKSSCDSLLSSAKAGVVSTGKKLRVKSGFFAFKKERLFVGVLLFALIPSPKPAHAFSDPIVPARTPIKLIQPLKAPKLKKQALVKKIPVPKTVKPVGTPIISDPRLTYGNPKAYALSQVGSVQFACLDLLWTKESNWNPYAVNSIGAMGIPQALGHGNVFALGDWKAQVDWGLNYISATYGSSCAAWSHSQSYNWY